MKTFRKSFIKTKLLKETLAKESFIKAQSAMEYLMTYGWAILIIAVVLGALFELGVFNANNFAPKAPPGSCQVFRPNGPGTTSFINLEGICSGELPQYVAKIFNPPSATYPPSPGSSTQYIYLSNVNLITGNVVTVTGWVLPVTVPGFCSDALLSYGGHTCSGTSIVVCLDNESGNIYPRLETWCNDYAASSGPTISLNRWNFVAGVLNGQTVNLYVNGYAYPAGSIGSVNIVSGDLYIGIEGGGSQNGNELLANVQLYNTSLSANEIQALYLEGIGGAPIDLQHLVGWWPLNGNANDYSGNGNNGQANNVNFVGNWYSAYTPP